MTWAGELLFLYSFIGRPHWPRSIRRGSVAAGCWYCGFEYRREKLVSVCCECCVLSGRVLHSMPIFRQEESYWVWCVCVCCAWVFVSVCECMWVWSWRTIVSRLWPTIVLLHPVNTYAFMTWITTQASYSDRSLDINILNLVRSIFFPWIFLPFCWWDRIDWYRSAKFTTSMSEG